MEFFAVLPGGLYSLLAIYCSVFSPIDSAIDQNNIWEHLRPLVSELRKEPVTIILVLFFSYILGSIIRAFPVDWSEHLIPNFRVQFPFTENLKRNLVDFKNYSEALNLNEEKLPKLERDIIPPSVYNHWKDILSMNSENGFEHYQSFETRSRYFASMLWAGYIGVGSSIYFGYEALKYSCYLPPLTLFVLSTFISLAYGFQLRRVRKVEAKVLLSLYVAYLQKTEVSNYSSSQ